MNHLYVSSRRGGPASDPGMPQMVTVSPAFLERVVELETAIAALRHDRDRLGRDLAALRKLIQANSAARAADFARLAAGTP